MVLEADPNCDNYVKQWATWDKVQEISKINSGDVVREEEGHSDDGDPWDEVGFDVEVEEGKEGEVEEDNEEENDDDEEEEDGDLEESDGDHDSKGATGGGRGDRMTMTIIGPLEAKGHQRR